jgi:nitrite reductase/ring-hydroxylating ferredoxin subunit
MERKNFLKTCGFACLSGSVLISALEGCGSSKMIAGTIDNSNLKVPLSSFQQDKSSFRKYILVNHPDLKYPVCVYRFSDTEYTALLMRCTHQGAELQVFGDRLECPAHGSQFSDTGKVQNGPADTNLRGFPVTVNNDQLFISLK